MDRSPRSPRDARSDFTDLGRGPRHDPDNDDDSLTIQKDGHINSVVYTVTEPGAGYVELDGRTIAFCGLDSLSPVTIEKATPEGTLSISTLQINVVDGLDHDVHLSEANVVNGIMTVVIDAPVGDLTCPVPTGPLTLNLGSGDDTVAVDALFHLDVEINSGGGSDSITMTGSTADDSFTAESGYAQLTSGASVITANDFAATVANAVAGQDDTDTAELYSSPGDELLEAGDPLEANKARLSNAAEGWSSMVVGFDTVTVHSAGGVDTGVIDFESIEFGFVFDTVYWDETTDGNWSELHWLDGQGAPLAFFPDSPWINAVTGANAVTLGADRSVFNLAVEGGGSVTATDTERISVGGELRVDSNGTFTTTQTVNFEVPRVTVADGGSITVDTDPLNAFKVLESLTFGPGAASIECDNLVVGREGQACMLSAFDPTATLAVTGTVELLDDTQYLCRLGDEENSPIVSSTGNVALAGTLTLEAVEKLGLFGPPGQQVPYGDSTRTIITSALLEGDPPYPFSNEPAEGDELGYGVFLTDQGVTYSSNAVLVDLFQAADGDTDGDREVRGKDIQNILAANLFGVADPDPPATWPQGDFNGDGQVSGSDIQAILAANLFGTGPYVAGGGSSADGGIMPGGSGDGVTDLKLRASGLTIDSDGATISGYVVQSKSAALTGSAAVNLGSFQEDQDDCISGNFGFTLAGTHLLGDVLADPSTLDLLDDLAVTYTLDGQAGIYVATLDAGTLSWDGLGDGAWDSTTQWTGDAVFSSPNNATYVIVETDTVSVTADADAASLTVTNGGSLAVDSGQTLQIVTGLQLQSTAEYVCRLDAAATGLLAVAGGAALDGTLSLQAEDYLGDLSLGQWGGYTRPIIVTYGGVGGQFADVPAPHDVDDHLGCGVFTTDLFDFDGGHGQVVTYDADAVYVDLFQAAIGDCNGDRQVNGGDIQDILAANKFGKTEEQLRAEGGWPAVWTEGDFDGDGLVTGSDIQAVMSSNLFGTGIYWPAQGGGGGSAPEGMSMSVGEFLDGMFMEETSRFSAEDLAALYDLREMIDSRGDDADADVLAAIDAVLATA